MQEKFKHLRANKDRVSASQYNKLVDLVSRTSNSLLSHGVISSEGFVTRRPTVIGGSTLKIFKVQTVATGDGVYNCERQKLDSSDWTDTTGARRYIDSGDAWVEVLNLLEMHVVSGYTRGLARSDLILAYKMIDDEAHSRWVGYPLTPGPRMFRTTEAATANTQIICNALVSTGNEASESADILYNIEVNCRICNGSALNSAIPRLANDDYLLAEHIRGEWWCTTVFQTSEDCDCYEAP